MISSVLFKRPVSRQIYIFSRKSKTFLFFEQLLQIFRECYSAKNLSEASRLLVNKLFGKYGIVILDASDIRLKRQLIPIIKRDVVWLKKYYF